MADYRDYVGLDFTSYLSHYGKGHLDGGNSGRYPWGSTNNVKRSAAIARENTKFLNKNEKRLAKDVSKQAIFERRFNKLIRKQNKKLDKLIKEKNAAPIKNKKVQKLEGKLDELEYKMALQQDSIDTTKELIDSTIKQLSKSGYDIHAEQKQYDVAFGKYLVSQFLLGPAGTAVLSAVIKPDEQFIDGNKWKVSVPDSKVVPYDRDAGKALDEYNRIKQKENNARDKSKMPTSSGLTESQRKAFNQAKNEDKWSLDFLEVADPDNEWSDQKMLREYKEYLKDPEGWMQRR